MLWCVITRSTNLDSGRMKRRTCRGLATQQVYCEYPPRVERNGPRPHRVCLSGMTKISRKLYSREQIRKKAPTPDVSIILCTRNRLYQLRETLRSLSTVRIPSGCVIELLVIDNASEVDVCEVVTGTDLGPIQVRCLREGRPGLAVARNTGVRQARGSILLFTDDDVRFPANWLREMTAPIHRGEADAVAGGVTLAPYLRRPWQVDNPWLTSPLASTRALDPEQPERMVGANMAITREVLEHVPPFDPNLGAGSELGMGEETLLTHQIKGEGFRLVAAFHAAVEHHCAEERLLRVSYLQAAARIGRSQGYIDYHWKHASHGPTRLMAEIAWRYAKLVAGRLLRRSELRSEGLPEWEMVLLTQIYHWRQLLTEHGSPRKYQPQATPVS
jgi:glucosyl-dolichyl phosphate glucuronosyltransferase